MNRDSRMALNRTAHEELTFEGVDNFRDFGGLPAGPGRRVAPGVLFRSGHQGRATAADLERLRALGLGLVIDLRRPEERLREPCRRTEDFTAVVVEDEHPDPSPDGFMHYLATAELSPASMRVFLRGYYRKAPFEPRIVLVFSRALEALAETEGAVLVHCAAGKDRTGLLAVFLHHLLGVSFEDSLRDYLRTNDPERIARRLPVFGAHVQALTGRVPDEATLRAALGVEREYLEIALEAITARSGSLDAYVEQELKVTPALRARLAARCLV